MMLATCHSTVGSAITSSAAPISPVLVPPAISRATTCPRQDKQPGNLRFQQAARAFAPERRVHAGLRELHGRGVSLDVES
jgi:hypothetical protein